MSGTAGEVPGAYGAQAAGLADMLGRTIAPGDPDRVAIEEWADGIGGRILDVGSGTGRWAGHLAGRGHDVEGIEPAEEFVAIARQAHPEVPFRVAAVHDLPAMGEWWSGILAWYSLIHLAPDAVPGALRTLRGVLSPGGGLLIGFFDGPRVGPLTHPVAPAYRWSMEAMTRALEDAGFLVDSRRGSSQDPGESPHALITARAA